MVDEEVTPRPAISEIRKQYEDEQFYQDDRAAAEYAYALAVRLREVGQTDEARRYAEECVRIAESLPSNSLDDVASTRQSVGGVRCRTTSMTAWSGRGLPICSTLHRSKRRRQRRLASRCSWTGP